MAKTLFRRWKDDCGRKREYQTVDAANAAAADLMEKNPGDWVGSFPCPWPPETHPHWHIGHQPPPGPDGEDPLDRMAHRFGVIDCNPHPTPWQVAYVEDVRYLLGKLGETST